MRTEDDARHRPIPGDLYLCHYRPHESTQRETRILRVISVDTQRIEVESLEHGYQSGVGRCSYWRVSGLTRADIAAGSFERWIPAPENPAPETP